MVGLYINPSSNECLIGEEISHPIRLQQQHAMPHRDRKDMEF